MICDIFLLSLLYLTPKTIFLDYIVCEYIVKVSMESSIPQFFVRFFRPNVALLLLVEHIGLSINFENVFWIKISTLSSSRLFRDFLRSKAQCQDGCWQRQSFKGFWGSKVQCLDECQSLKRLLGIDVAMCGWMPIVQRLLRIEGPMSGWMSIVQRLLGIKGLMPPEESTWRSVTVWNLFCSVLWNSS